MLKKLFSGFQSSAAGTMLSRVAGAARDIAIANALGAGRVSDAFWIAFTVPSLFRRFVADEGLTGVMVPALSREESRADRESARKLAGAVLVALVLACVVICVLGIALAPALVRMCGWGMTRNPEQLELAISLTRWMMPFVVTVSLLSWCEGVLNLRDHYFLPKLAPALVNAGMVAAVLGLTGALGSPERALVAGLLVGGVAQVL
ncbi:MAG: lipid II flippase MurJ, partial [Myxococcota bacterium]|nr:lipid II flippase MurJ [Myxococcota bacterium]